jgi:hypothetical protein
MVQGLWRSVVIPNRPAICLIALFALQSAPSTAATDFNPSVEAWSRDIDRVVAAAVTVHPDAFTKIGKATFYLQAENIKNELPSLTQEQRAARAMQLVASIGDGHTVLETKDAHWGQWYPIRVYEFSDGYFITGALQSSDELVGAQILEVRGLPVEAAAEKARSLFGADNTFGARNNLFALSDAVLMKGLGLAEPDGTLKLKLRLSSGRVVERQLASRPADAAGWEDNLGDFEWRFRHEMAGPPIGTAEKWIGAYRHLPYSAYRTADKTRPPHLVRRLPFFSESLPSGDYYIQINLVTGSGDPEALAPSMRRALGEVDQLRPKRLIIDIRYNIGGDGSQVPAMIHEFIKREDNPPWQGLYLLTGRRTFSAGVMIIDAFLDNTDVSLVGEPAGAGLNCFGDATEIPLPDTGLLLHMSTVRHQLGSSSDRQSTITVDARATFASSEYAAGTDPAVDAIAAGQEMRAVGIIALVDGAVAARKVYDERKKSARGDPSVQPREAELQRVAWRLQDAGRKAEALALFALRVDAYPNSAKAWYELGSAQIEAGQKPIGLQSYQRSLELDPHNVDNAEERSVIAKSGSL